MTVDFVEFLTQLRGELERWPRTGEPSRMLSGHADGAWGALGPVHSWLWQRGHWAVL